jgi:NAD-dependent deacetylase
MQGEIATTVAADWRQAQRIVVLTGAGMSAESGVATFRGARHALWERFDPMQLATAEAFRADSALVWGWYLWRMAAARAAAANAGHRALAALAADKPGCTVVTQNVDDLHERGGSPAVLHLHGDLFAHRCFDCSREYDGDPLIGVDASAPQQRVPPPRCHHCGGPIRPGVVWFGESLPERAFAAALSACERAELVLVIGTSGLVHPAAGLPALAKRQGARIIEINPEASAISSLADLHWRSTAARALPQLRDALA